MDNIGVGALVNGERPPTKKALREALTNAPATVELDSTAAVGAHIGETFRGDNIPDGVRLNVVGPDPYTARNWYANVTRGRDGKPRLS